MSLRLTSPADLHPYVTAGAHAWLVPGGSSSPGCGPGRGSETNDSRQARESLLLYRCILEQGRRLLVQVHDLYRLSSRLDG